MADLAELNIVVRYKSARDAAKALDSLSVSSDRVSASTRAMGGATQRSASTAARSAALLGRTFDRAARSVTRGMQAAVRGVRRFTRAVLSLRFALVTLGFTALTGTIIRFADGWQLATNRLRPFLKDIKLVTAAQEELFQISQRNRQSFDESINLFSRVIINRESIGAELSELLEFVDSVQKTLALSGSSPAETRGALRQLSQLVGSPVIRGAGQELNSIQEQTVRLFSAITEGLGNVRNEPFFDQKRFRELAAEGKLTAKDIVDALKTVRPQLQEEFDAIVPTIGESFQVLQNSAMRSIGLLSQATGAGEAFGNRIRSIATAVDDLTLVLINMNKQAQMTTVMDWGEGSAAFDARPGVRRIPDQPLVELTGTFGEQLTNVLLLQLETRILPALVKLAANLPIVFIANLLRALSTLGTAIGNVIAPLISAVLDEFISQLRQRSAFLSGLFNKVVNNPSSLGESFEEAMLGLEQIARVNVDNSLVELGDSIRFVRQATQEWAEELNADNLDLSTYTDANLAQAAIQRANALRSQAISDIIATARQTARQSLDDNDLFGMIEKLQDAGFSGDLFDSRGLQAYRQEVELLRSAGYDVGDALGLNEEGLKQLRRYENLLQQITNAERVRRLADTVSSSLAEAFSSVIARTRTWKEALQEVYQQLIRIGLSSFVEGPLSGGLSSLFSGLFAPSGNAVNRSPIPTTPSALGNAFVNGRRVQAFAKGGILDSPMMFGMRGGLGLAGEAGPEAVLPLKRGSSGELGVVSQGGGTTNVTVNVYGAQDTASMRRVSRQVAAAAGDAISRAQKRRRY